MPFSQDFIIFHPLQQCKPKHPVLYMIYRSVHNMSYRFHT